MLVGVHLATSHAVRLHDWNIPPTNPALIEAAGWRQGRLALDVGPEGRTAAHQRPWDTAVYHGRVYNVYPPLFTGLSLAALILGGWQGVPPGVFYTPWLVAAVALPLPLVGFWAFQQVVRRAAWSAVLTAYLLLGTPLLPVLVGCRVGSINAIHHALATTGLLLIAGDLLGRRRIWPAVIGLLIAAWSRQPTLLYGLAILWVAWRAGRRRTIVAAAGLAVAGGALMTLNWLRFDSPFDPGYRYIYAQGRETQWYGARALAHGVLSPHFVPENAWYMNLAPPRFRLSPAFIQQDNDNQGVSIWMTSPLLLGAFFGIRRWWRLQPARTLMLASLPVILVFLMYHNPGTPQIGYFRFALDFLPVWLVVLAPWAVEGRRRTATLACLTWSAWYFHLLV